MHVSQVSCWQDPAGRPGHELLDAWPTLVRVAAATARAGLDVSVLQSAAREEDIERDGVRFHFVADAAPSPLRRRLGTWAWPLPVRLAARLRTLGPDVVHFHGLSFPRHVRWLSLGLGRVPLLVQDHADHTPPRWRIALHRQALAEADGVAFTAAAQAEPFVKAGAMPAGTRVFEVPESSSTFSPGDGRGARAATRLHGDPCLLWLGHLDANKDPLTVVESLRLAADRLPDPHLWLCYRKAGLLAEVRSAADRHGLHDRVHLLGPQPHERVEMLLRAADFLVQASHVEGSGYAVIEALACGTTPLVTDIPSFRSLTGGGAYGGLCPVGDASAMAEMWLKWASRDPAVLRERARAHFERELSFDAVAARLRDVYRTLAQHR